MTLNYMTVKDFSVCLPCIIY